MAADPALLLPSEQHSFMRWWLMEGKLWSSDGKAKVRSSPEEDAEEIAYLTVFLASDKAWCVTGEVVVANGGTGNAVYY
jgi:hypothetical protein